jgi:hypothetical protein
LIFLNEFHFRYDFRLYKGSYTPNPRGGKENVDNRNINGGCWIIVSQNSTWIKERIEDAFKKRFQMDPA